MHACFAREAGAAVRLTPMDAWMIYKGDTMPNRTDTIRHLANVMVTVRPEWDLSGCLRILEGDSRPLAELIATAMMVTYDKTARTPAVLRSKTSPVFGIDPSSRMPQYPDIRMVLAAVKQPDDVAHRGAALAREEITKAKADEW